MKASERWWWRCEYRKAIGLYQGCYVFILRLLLFSLIISIVYARFFLFFFFVLSASHTHALLCYSSLKTITKPPLFTGVDCQTIFLFIVFGDAFPQYCAVYVCLSLILFRFCQSFAPIELLFAANSFSFS